MSEKYNNNLLQPALNILRELLGNSYAEINRQIKNTPISLHCNVPIRSNSCALTFLKRIK